MRQNFSADKIYRVLKVRAKGMSEGDVGNTGGYHLFNLRYDVIRCSRD
jgi:hypothetical protein